jgi:HlyD family secretion protein
VTADVPVLDFEARRVRYQRYGLAACLVFLLLLLIAATLIQITGAVAATGFVVQRGQNKAVQHPEGGPVAEMLVQEGDPVRAGERLVLLDGAQTEAQHRIYARRRYELRVRLARLEALEQGRDAFEAPTAPNAAGLDDAFVRQVIATHRGAFDSTRASLDGMRRRLRDRIDGLGSEIAGLERQIGTNEQQVALLADEIDEVSELVDEELVSKARLTALQRQRVAVLGEIEALRTSAVRSANALGEARTELEQVDRDFRQQLWSDIEAARAEFEEVSASLAAATDRLSRLVITAPAGGRVHELSVRNVDAVIRPGEVIMQIVPEDAGPVLDARVGLTDIDQVHLGQEVRVRFDTFDLRTTPEIRGRVVRISPDRSIEAETGDTYYSVLVELPPEELATLGENTIIPGLPATAMFTTNQRSLLDYLTKPLRTQLFNAFRED